MNTTRKRKQSRSKRIGDTIRVFRGLVLCMAFAGVASAQDTDSAPEYMKLNYSDSVALEIKGQWDAKDGVFRASDIELLPQLRSPKLRSVIQSIDRKNKTISVLGRTIKVSTETMFVGADSTGDMFSQLQVGARVEVSCKARSDTDWRARKIKIGSIKSGDKIKSGIQRSAVDGKAPDTLIIHGLKIILDEKTDVNRPTDRMGRLEIEKFDYAGYTDPDETNDGLILGEKFLLTGNYRGPITSESEYDLTQTVDSDLSEVEPSLRGELTAFWSPTVTSFAQVRARKRLLISNDTLRSPSEDIRMNITQLYTLFRDVGTPGLSLAIGRQDIEDPREWVFDEYLDAFRALYYGWRSLIVEGAYIPSISPVKDKYDSWTDLYFSAAWRTERDAEIGVYMLKRSDTSPRNREPVWWGARFYGEVADGVRPWLDYSLLRGEDKSRSQSAWAVDLGVTLTAENNKMKPSASLGYAVGSGDETSGDNISNEFRQTGYEDNVARLSGVSEVHYYGEAFNPELSNLKVFTLGAGFQPIADASLELIYHTYKQHQVDNELSDSGLLDPPARPNGASGNLGTELDIIATTPELLDKVRLRWTLAFFSPGDAYVPRQESAFLSKLDIDIEL